MDIKQALTIVSDKDKKSTYRLLFMLFLVISLSIILLSNKFSSSDSQLQQILNRGTLRVVTRESPTTYYLGYQGAAGVEYQLASQFAERLGLKLEIRAVDSITEILTALQKGTADLAAAGLTITEERKNEFYFAPPYQEVSQKLVFKQGKRWPRNIEQLRGDLRVMADSSHALKLLKLKQKHASLGWSETVTDTSEDLLAKILDESIDYTISDSNELALNRRFYPELAIGFSIGKPEQLAWAFDKTHDDSLRAEAINFFSDIRASGELAQLIERNYGHVEDFDYVGTRKFLQAAKNKLPKYTELFQTAAGLELDWRLLAAISYQESHWNPHARSPTGVRGMMMLTRTTAKELGIKNRLDVEKSITGGAKYFSAVLKRIPERVQEPDKTWLALASYNIGWGHVEDARILTQKQGDDPNRWVDVKERLPLLRQRKYYKKTRYGYARGDEPVQYVDNIRRYYETLQWMIDVPDSLFNKPEINDQSAEQLLATTKPPETDKIKNKKLKAKKPIEDVAAENEE